MRLVDADALIHTHKSEVATIGKDWTIDDLATAIETAPTIEAIPVEWMWEHDLYYTGISGGSPYMNALIKAWQKEQEMR